ncbi:AAA family ATPase [Ruegeria lacuscaerulensis]|uniref:AAA family ATPase n=1 Tax=Ruegeria lacuscaerulensis TaxID=55218 RepID=UPI00147ACD31|nr:AAA family ATPase [Ruegeria lacuscaerulensis]
MLNKNSKTTTKAQAQQVYDQNRQAALDAAAHDLRVFPVHVTHDPKKPGKKKAKVLVKSWVKDASTDPVQINSWWDENPSAVPGMPTGDFLVIDLDDRDGKDGSAAYKAMGLDPEDALFTVETPSGGEHLYFENSIGLSISQDNIAPGIDTRGKGGFVFAPGARTVFGEYRIKRGDLNYLQLGCLTAVPQLIFHALTKQKCEKEQSALGECDLDTIRDALNVVPNDLYYGDWIETLMAVHHATGGAEEGLALALAWSAGYDGFSIKEVQSKWRSFGKFEGNSITKKTLFMKAREHGWDDPLALLTDADVEIGETTDLRSAGHGSLDAEARELLGLPPSRLKFLSPTDCETLPTRNYLIKGLLGEGDVAAVIGAPGAGKSLLAPYLGYAIAQGAEVFGCRNRQGGVFYVAAEDSHGMRARVQALRGQYGDADAFRLVEGVSDLLSENSEDLKALLIAVEDRRPVLIVIDTLAIAFPGLEENEAKAMGRVVAVARSLTRWGAAVVLVHHDTKAGDGLPRGHSILNGALDLSLHLKRNGKVVCVRPTKNRNGSTDQQLAFRVDTVQMGNDDDGEPVLTAICVEEHATELQKTGKPLARSKRVALEILTDLLRWQSSVSEDEWRAACIADPKFSAAETDNGKRKTFREARVDLADRELIALRDRGFVLTENDHGAQPEDDHEIL